MRWIAMGVGMAFGLGMAQAQDISGLEDCTQTHGLDKRTGCFQSNVEYLNRSLAKTALDLQQKLNAANGEIAGLKATVATLQKKLDELQSPARKPEGKK